MPNNRRIPLQPRSRERVQTILTVAADLIVSKGVEGLTTSAVAKRSNISVGTLYQYFADREAIVDRLLDCHLAALDSRMVEQFAKIETLTIRTIVETAIRTHVDFYRETPSFVRIWVHGRTSPIVLSRQHQRNVGIAKWLREVVDQFGMVRNDSPELGAWFAVEIGDRVLEMAFRRDSHGNSEMIAEGVEMIIVYLDRYATQGGRDGVRMASLPKMAQ